MNSHLQYDWSKGLFSSQTYDAAHVPNGYLSLANNVLMDEQGHIVPRGAFKHIATNFSFPNTFDENSFAPGSIPAQVSSLSLGDGSHPIDRNRYTRVFDLHNQGINTPTAMWVQWDSTGAVQRTRVLNDIQTTGTSELIGRVDFAPPTEIWQSACQYKDRLYVTDGAGVSAVTFPVSGFAAPAGTRTLVLKAALPASLTKMFAFKGRLFGIYNSRIYWTEQAVTGGYPENWNGGNNFIEVITDYGIAAINNVFVLNDRIFLFTEKGIYVLSASGPTSSWDLQVVNPDIRIYSENSVCAVGNGFVLTDRHQLYLFNGTAFTEVLTTALGTFNQILELFPFEDGVLLQKWSVTTYTPASGYIKGNVISLIYFDGQHFWPMSFPNLGTTNAQGIVATIVNKYSAASKFLGRTYIFTRIGIWYYDRFEFNGDTDENSQTIAYAGEFTTGIEQLGEHELFKRGVQGHIDISRIGVVTTIPCSVSASNTVTSQPLDNTTTAIATAQKFSAAGLFRKISVSFTSSMDASWGAGLVGPPWRVRNISVSYTDVSESPDQNARA